MQRLCPAKFLCSRAKMQQKKNDPCFWSWTKWLFRPSFVQDQKPSRSLQKWEKRGRDFECVFFQNLFKISNRIFEASFFLGGGLAKKNTAVFSLQYFFWLVRCVGEVLLREITFRLIKIKLQKVILGIEAFFLR